MAVNLFPVMASLGRNSHLTKQVENILRQKLSDQEIKKFFNWLQIVEQDKGIAVNQAKRKFIRGHL